MPSNNRKQSVRCKAQRRKAATALLASVVVVLAASTVTVTTAQTQGCELYNTDSEAVSWNTTYPTEQYFGCADDGGFLVGVAATKDDTPALDALLWTCSGGGVIGSSSSGSDSEYSVSFTVGITKVEASVLDELPYLADMFVEGYNADDDEAGVSFNRDGPLGGIETLAIKPDKVHSSCNDGSFATGVTMWASTNYVYGVRLECAAVTEECIPPNYPASLLEGGSTTPAPTPAPTTARSSSSSGNMGAIVGASVGGGLLLIAVAVFATCFIRRRSRENKRRNSDKIPPGIAGVGPMVAEGGQAASSGRNTPPPVYADLVA